MSRPLTIMEGLRARAEREWYEVGCRGGFTCDICQDCGGSRPCSCQRKDFIEHYMRTNQEQWLCEVKEIIRKSKQDAEELKKKHEREKEYEEWCRYRDKDRGQVYIDD